MNSTQLLENDEKNFGLHSWCDRRVRSLVLDDYCVVATTLPHYENCLYPAHHDCCCPTPHQQEHCHVPDDHSQARNEVSITACSTPCVRRPWASGAILSLVEIEPAVGLLLLLLRNAIVRASVLIPVGAGRGEVAPAGTLPSYLNPASSGCLLCFLPSHTISLCD